jgi:serralysin
VLIKSNQLIAAVEGSNQYHTLVHELGHVLGLTDIDRVSTNSYDHSKTIMSYNSYGGIIGHAPMLYDIAAAQYLYGANTTYNATNTNYNYNTSVTANCITGESKLWTIWDGGGTADHISAVSVSGANDDVTIDLRGGVDANGDVRFSAIARERVAIALDPAQDWEKSIIIEHATGASGNDLIVGNDGNNSLRGSAASDTVS